VLGWRWWGCGGWVFGGDEEVGLYREEKREERVRSLAVVGTARILNE
jgi:hypothetical protein